ncbi:hypothetical protein D3C86_1652500 [compost metagenome]
MQQQSASQSLALSSRMHHQALDKGAGPALAHAHDALGIQGDEAQGRIVFGVGLEALLPDFQRRHPTATFLVAQLHQVMHGARSLGAIVAQDHPLRPGDSG